MASGEGPAAGDSPLYQLQSLINIVGPEFVNSDPPIRVQCAQASGNEIYVGCSNGDLLRFALQLNVSSPTPDSYTLLSRQSVPNNRPIDDIILLPSLSRALVLSDRQIFVYILPMLDIMPSTAYKPIRQVLSIAIDEQQQRYATRRNGNPPSQPNPISFCVIKRQSVLVFHVREKPVYEKEIPLPLRVHLAKRSGPYMCIADPENYNMINLETASLIPLLPISQAPSENPDAEAPRAPVVKPFILVITESEFLILSWTGTTTLGLFITGEGEPVRGTLEWSSHPVSVAFDDPHITTLLSDGTVEIHNIETQALVQTVPPSSSALTPAVPIPTDRTALLACSADFVVPSTERQTKLRPTPVKLRPPEARPEPAPEVAPVTQPEEEEQDQSATAPTNDDQGGDDIEPTPYDLGDA
ncbi:uncharacterized protein PHACADRAFT_178770 [Phanerochaete carnosa HHB-10118-sp]|uniref:CNH domain-containing protein n=1 Tax=Phanerochaete carnosa (strain HHB-10118-sp) TaxID=650164 RepID=K5UKI2_PHACS|nr:uncharacterized protein PHACADRAFT_178770 [Phanerochaete carnosa HHB-10118-sp]EKM50146.1 hypothetical protein PHACADRAFT_178770 [Phanerochaete carnosa HHB-10118-sp]